ncbi:oligosaccharide flippase family protein [Candidatus Woesearchaeota archaeon]|nr:oligosaccharide flippase family protein [Candidatus Woesearchaeota archaeon]
MSTTKNAAYVLSSQVILLLSGTLINLGMGRFLGPELYGRFGIVYAVASVLNVLLTPGIIQAIAKFTAERKDHAQAIAKAMLKNQLIMGTAIAAIYFFLAAPIAIALKDNSLQQLLWILTPLVVLYSITAVYGGYLTGLGRFPEQAKQLILYSASRLVLTFLLAYLFSVTGAVIALPLSSAIALAYLAYTARIAQNSSGFHSTKELYGFSVPIAMFSVLIIAFMNSDLLQVQAMLGNSQLTGYYAAAGTVARINYFVLTALGMIMLPAVAEKLKSSVKSAQSFVQEAMRYVFILMLPASLVMMATAKPLVMLLYKSDYAAAAGPAAILTLGMAALTFAYLLTTIINALGKPSVTVFVSASALVAAIAANTVLIPKYGLNGAAAGIAAIAAAEALVFGIIVYRKLGRFINYDSLAKITVASLAVFAIAQPVQLSNKFLLPLEYAMLGIVYLGILVVLREIRKEDIKKLKSLLPQQLQIKT